MDCDYYGWNGIDPLTAFKDGLISKTEYRGFLKGNIIKYLCRCDYKHKSPINDLVKAGDYLNCLLDLYEEGLTPRSKLQDIVDKCNKTIADYVDSPYTINKCDNKNKVPYDKFCEVMELICGVGSEESNTPVCDLDEALDILIDLIKLYNEKKCHLEEEAENSTYESLNECKDSYTFTYSDSKKDFELGEEFNKYSEVQSVTINNDSVIKVTVFDDCLEPLTDLADKYVAVIERYMDSYGLVVERGDYERLEYWFGE